MRFAQYLGRACINGEERKEKEKEKEIRCGRNQCAKRREWHKGEGKEIRER